MVDWTGWTIEERDGPCPWVVVEIGVYPDDSVLAGQDRKSFRDSFSTLAEAQEAYPKVTTGYREVNTSTAHLPDREMNAWEEQHYWDAKDGASEE